MDDTRAKKYPVLLNQPMAGYYHTQNPDEDIELTHTAPGTPCGEYLRRYWHPVALSEEVKDLPVRIKIMHQDLVVFRDKRNRVGLLELHCAHRGASLEYGLICETGIRCCYHGWQFDIDGSILEMPTEFGENSYKNELYQGAFPTREYAGFIWGYLGPPEKRPPFPRFDILETEDFDHEDSVTKTIWPCNWLQIRDNFMDPLHAIVLHTISPEGTGFTKAARVFGEIDFVETPIGMVYLNARRMKENIWVRMAENIFPNMGSFGLNGEDGSREHPFNGPEATVWSVPMDDTHTINFRMRHFRSWIPKSEQPPKISFGQQANRTYEETQRLPGDYEAQVSQRPIAIHALEHPIKSDRGIMIMRKRLREWINVAKRGEDPPLTTELKDGEIISTYCNDTVLRVPEAATEEEDRKLRLEVAHRLIQDYIKEHPSKVTC
jgi:phenylpropionate dioxygenase-like ring-hydroxylating dioxygenase large terminal subunit